jgi:hypothetical protein
MPAVYPIAVKPFPIRTDTVDTIFAANVNDIQLEVTAVEQTLGVNPHVWAGVSAPPVGARPLSVYATTTPMLAATYASVADRLNAIQTQVANLTQMANQLAFPSLGPQQPVSSIQCPGQMMSPGFGAWQAVLWGGAAYDPSGMYQGGSNLLCPQSGWYQMALSVWAPVAQVAPGSVHHANVRVLVNGIEAATGASHAQPGVVDAHRLNCAWAGPWSAGQNIQIQFSHSPGDANNSQILVTAAISLTYQRPAN